MKITIDNIPPEKVNVIVHLLNDVLSNVSVGSKIEVSDAVTNVFVKSFYCGALVAGKDQCETQCLGCAGFDRICNE
jgi:hypothetical protein